MVVPPDLEIRLLESLKTFTDLKLAFKQKMNEVPWQTIKHLNYDEMSRIKKNGSNELYIEKANLLGFSKDKKPYKGFASKELSVFTQATDYIELLFCFDDTVHYTITNQLSVPLDLEELNKHPKKFNKKKRKNILDKFYTYIEYLCE